MLIKSVRILLLKSTDLRFNYLQMTRNKEVLFDNDQKMYQQRLRSFATAQQLDKMAASLVYNVELFDWSLSRLLLRETFEVGRFEGKSIDLV